MSSKFIIDSMLPKYHQQFHHQQLFQSPTSTSAIEATLASVVSYSSSVSPSGSSPQHSNSSASSTSPASRMYPYVSAAHHHQQQAVAAAAFGAAAASGSMVPGAFSSSASTAALAAAAAVDAATDKSCRYTAGLTGNVAPTDSMVNYTLGHHHQNGSAVSAANSVSAASASMAVAAQFYHQAASAVVDPLNSCSQPTAPGGQPIPDIPRYPWMSITGM